MYEIANEDSSWSLEAVPTSYSLFVAVAVTGPYTYDKCHAVWSPDVPDTPVSISVEEYLAVKPSIPV